MGAISATDIISIIQSEIENFDFDTESRETGEVIYVGDGIATIYGIDHAMYGEIVVFDNGVKGMVQDIRQNEIGVILFGRDHGQESSQSIQCSQSDVDSESLSSVTVRQERHQLPQIQSSTRRARMLSVYM